MIDNTLFKNKSGSAFYLIYGLFFLLILGTLYIVFNQAAENDIRPILDSSGLEFSEESKAYADRYMGAWRLAPYIVTFIVGMFFILWAGIRGDKNGYN